MKIFLAILVALVYAVGSTMLICRIRPKAEDCEPSWGYRQSENPDITKRKRLCYLVDAGCLVIGFMLLCPLLDNWQTRVTLLIIGMIFPAFARSFPSGAVTIIWGLIAIFVIWQLPSTATREERVVNEPVEIATISNISGKTDSIVVEDHGQYLVFLKEPGSGVKQEKIPAEIVNGHYIDDNATPIVVYHYSDFYKRTFWSKERTKFLSRKLTAVDLYVKRWQLVNTF